MAFLLVGLDNKPICDTQSQVIWIWHFYSVLYLSQQVIQTSVALKNWNKTEMDYLILNGKYDIFQMLIFLMYFTLLEQPLPESVTLSHSTGYKQKNCPYNRINL